MLHLKNLARKLTIEERTTTKEDTKMLSQNVDRKMRIKNPIDAFPLCPACKLATTRPINSKHVVCGCGWNSISAYAELCGDVIPLF